MSAGVIFLMVKSLDQDNSNGDSLILILSTYEIM